MSDANQVALRKLAESTWNTTPGSAMTDVRFTSESLNFEIDNTQSQEIRSDRQVTDLVQTGANSNGDVAVEFSYGAHDDFIESALQSTFSTAFDHADTDISADSADDSFNAAGGDFATTLVTGQWIYVSGFTEAVNNGWHQIGSTTPTASKIIVTTNLTTEVAGDSVTIKSSKIRTGTTRKSFTLEKNFIDKTQFLAFRGMEVSQMQASVAAGEIMTGAFSFIGGSATRAGATAGTGAANAASTANVLNGVGNIGAILEGGSALSGVYITRVGFSVNNNTRGLAAIGTLGNVDLGHGEANITGEISMYFEDGDIYDKFIAGTESALSFEAADSAGNRMHFDFPRIKYATAPVPTPGSNQDVFLNATFQAIRHATYGYTMEVTLHPAS